MQIGGQSFIIVGAANWKGLFDVAMRVTEYP